MITVAQFIVPYSIHFDEVWFYSDTYLRAHFSPAWACSVLHINAKARSIPKHQHRMTVVITAIVASPAGPCTY